MTTEQRHQPLAAVSREAHWAWRAARVALPALAMLLAARLLAQLLGTFWWSIRFPYELQYAEGGVLFDAVNIARGGHIYQDYRDYPFTIASYTPFYPLLCAAGIKLFGVSFAYGRALSCGAAVAAAALVWATLRRTGASVPGSAIGGMLLLLSPTVHSSIVGRVDMTAAALSLGALYCVVRGGRWLIAAAILMTLATYTKQTTLAVPAASVVYLMWMRQRRSAVLLGAGWLAAVLVIFAVLEAATAGWFYRHVVIANRNRWDLEGLLFVWASQFYWPAPYLLGLGGVWLAMSKRAARVMTRTGAGQLEPWRLCGLYFVFALLISVTAGKVGAGANYLLEPLAGGCLMSGLAYHWISHRTGSWHAKTAWVAVWAALTAMAVFAFANPHMQALNDRPRWRRELAAEGNRVSAILRQTKGPVLCEVLGYLITTGHPVLLEPSEMTQVFMDGDWDQRPLLRDISRARFALIIVEWNPKAPVRDKWGTYGNRRWTQGMVQAILRSYRLVEKVGRLYIMAPRSSGRQGTGRPTSRPRSGTGLAAE